LINPLIIVRDIHYASSMIVAGIIFFDLFVASPVLRSDQRWRTSERSFRKGAEKILWIGLALSVVTAFAWLCLVAARIANKPWHEAITDGTVWTVLARTQFGFAWQARLLLAAALVACLLGQRKADAGRAAAGLKILASLLAGAYLGSLAFAGHGAEGPGFERIIHLTADALHLIAAGLWLGALVPFLLLLTGLRRLREEGWVSAAAATGNRFSTLGILAVGLLLVSGTINASFLLASMHSLIDTSYGRLLLLKIVLFAVMLSLAGINRQHLLPQLRDDAGFKGSFRTVHWLVGNSLAELALGLAIVLIVGALGVMAPANEIAAHVH